MVFKIKKHSTKMSMKCVFRLKITPVKKEPYIHFIITSYTLFPDNFGECDGPLSVKSLQQVIQTKAVKVLCKKVAVLLKHIILHSV